EVSLPLLITPEGMRYGDLGLERPAIRPKVEEFIRVVFPRRRGHRQAHAYDGGRLVVFELRDAERRASLQQRRHRKTGVAAASHRAVDVCSADRSTEAGNRNAGFEPADTVSKAEVARVRNRSLVQIEVRTGYDQRRIERRVRVRVGVGKLDLIHSDRSVI